MASLRVVIWVKICSVENIPENPVEMFDSGLAPPGYFLWLDFLGWGLWVGLWVPVSGLDLEVGLGSWTWRLDFVGWTLWVGLWVGVFFCWPSLIQGWT